MFLLFPQNISTCSCFKRILRYSRDILVNPFPHINAIRRLCSRQLFQNIVTKEEIAQNVTWNYPLATMFSTLSHKLSIQLWRFSMVWQNMFKLVCCRIVVWGKGLKKIQIWFESDIIFIWNCLIYMPAIFRIGCFDLILEVHVLF